MGQSNRYSIHFECYLINVDSLLKARQLAVPAASSIAVHTRSAQLQDKAEQQHLKRFVLNYEQREEAEEHSKGIVLDVIFAIVI